MFNLVVRITWHRTSGSSFQSNNLKWRWKHVNHRPIEVYFTATPHQLVTPTITTHLPDDKTARSSTADSPECVERSTQSCAPDQGPQRSDALTAPVPSAVFRGSGPGTECGGDPGGSCFVLRSGDPWCGLSRQPDQTQRYVKLYYL